MTFAFVHRLPFIIATLYLIAALLVLPLPLTLSLMGFDKPSVGQLLRWTGWMAVALLLCAYGLALA